MLEADEEFPEAAKVLIGIPLESGHRSVLFSSLATRLTNCTEQ